MLTVVDCRVAALLAMTMQGGDCCGRCAAFLLNRSLRSLRSVEMTGGIAAEAFASGI